MNPISKSDVGPSQSHEPVSYDIAEEYEVNGRMSDMEAAITNLTLRIEKLETEKLILKSRMDYINSRNEETMSEYSELETSYSKALENISKLEEEIFYYQERIALQSSSAELLQNKLSDSISPPYTFIKNREIFWVFKGSQGNTLRWNLPIDTYRELMEITEPKNENALWSPDGITFTVRDHSEFVDTTLLSPWVDEAFNYVSVRNEDKNEQNLDSQFLYEAWYITSQLTAYSPDIGEDPRWPLETLVEGGGDCEDFAILMTSMLKASSKTKDWQIQMVYFDSDHPENPKQVNHVSLFIKTDNFETFVDRSLDPSKNESWEYIEGWYFDISPTADLRTRVS